MNRAESLRAYIFFAQTSEEDTTTTEQAYDVDPDLDGLYDGEQYVWVGAPLRNLPFGKDISPPDFEEFFSFPS